MGNGQILIISNNPLVKNIKDMGVYFVPGSALQVLYQAYHHTAAGHRLLSHPLSGSFKAGVNPYRSVVLSGFKTAVDLAALTMLEKCISIVESGGHKSVKAEDDFALDFQKTDRYLLDSTLQSLMEVRCFDGRDL